MVLLNLFVIIIIIIIFEYTCLNFYTKTCLARKLSAGTPAPEAAFKVNRAGVPAESFRAKQISIGKSLNMYIQN